MSKLHFVFYFLVIHFFLISQQSFNKDYLVVSASIGIPHTLKSVAKLATKTDAFKNYFNGKIDVSVKGINPIAIKGEYGISNNFGVGICFASWNMKIDVIDYYSILHTSQTSTTNEIDTYKFNISSSSFGIRPNFHFPLQNRRHDVYIGAGLGFTKNSLAVNFSSTDVNKILPINHYQFSLPGGFYFAPTVGYRAYFNDYFGLNFDFGWEKGAIIQAGLVFKLDVRQVKNEK